MIPPAASLLEYSSKETIELKSVNLKPVKVFPFGRKTSGAYRNKLYSDHLEKDSITLGGLQKMKALFTITAEWER